MWRRGKLRGLGSLSSGERALRFFRVFGRDGDRTKLLLCRSIFVGRDDGAVFEGDACGRWVYVVVVKVREMLDTLVIEFERLRKFEDDEEGEAGRCK